MPDRGAADEARREPHRPALVAAAALVGAALQRNNGHYEPVALQLLVAALALAWLALLAPAALARWSPTAPGRRPRCSRWSWSDSSSSSRGPRSACPSRGRCRRSNLGS